MSFNLTTQPMDRPNYDPEAVVPMRQELTGAGFTELLTPDEVDQALGELSSDQTALFMVNSVCGCAAGAARPGVTLALQHRRIPDQLYTVFAGMEKAAVARLRERLSPHPPSSPAVALFRGGELIGMLNRSDIEHHSAIEVAQTLVNHFERHCAAEGPSIPRAEFEKLASPQICGSTIEPYRG